MRFTWDPKKAAANLRKHGVSFEEATTAFDDPHGIYEADSGRDDRGNLVARSTSARMLFVVHLYFDADAPVPTIRLISARKATKSERKRYENPKRH